MFFLKTLPLAIIIIIKSVIICRYILIVEINGESELKAVHGELPDDAGEREAEEGGGASRPRESDPPQ